MHIGVKALRKGLRKIGTKTMKTVNKIGSKHTLNAIGHVAQDVGTAAAMMSMAAPTLAPIGAGVMAAAAGVGAATRIGLDAKSSVAAAKRGDMERAIAKANSAATTAFV